MAKQQKQKRKPVLPESSMPSVKRGTGIKGEMAKFLERRTLAFQIATTKEKKDGGCKAMTYGAQKKEPRS